MGIAITGQVLDNHCLLCLSELWIFITLFIHSVMEGFLDGQEMWVRSLGQEDLLEKEMPTSSSIPARKFPWTEEPGGL